MKMNKNYIYIALGLLGLYLFSKSENDRDETTEKRDGEGSGITPDKANEVPDTTPVSVPNETLEFQKEDTSVTL